ncbi:MAG TPA: hypothetical protein VHP83_13345 [Aggregatilineaceae bacterium]|nr:hypothetical protein [Aggregatilineaceae bacterium]
MMNRILDWISYGAGFIVRMSIRLALLIVFLLMFNSEGQQDTSLTGRATALSRDYLFDYVDWEVRALWDKVKQELLGVHPFLDAKTEREAVLDFIDKMSRVQAVEDEIERIYADPNVVDPHAATAQLRAQRNGLRDELADNQRLVEGIIESQVSSVLLDEGFGWANQVLPPVSMHFSALPMVLIISPRDHIDFAANLKLVHMTLEERAALEAEIDAELDVASLIEPIGGMSLYPAMIEEPDYPPEYLNYNISWAIEVTAHEWSHHYLAFYPLGLEYGVQPETQIINETVATFFGRALAAKVMQRYYPDLNPPRRSSFLSSLVPSSPAPITDPDAPEPFNYGSEMAYTRATVDFLLWQGRIEAAETFMEYQRREFVRNGYSIRKLNQAYFAFYGGYQGSPGAGGVDPIGPAVEEILSLSPNLEQFLITLRGVTNRTELLATLEIARD